MANLFNVFGLFSLGLALLGIGSSLFGAGGFLGFFLFLFGLGGAIFWFLMGFGLRKLGHLREAVMPSTTEATLRRRLFLTSLKYSVRVESNRGLDQLKRLEHVCKILYRTLGERLSPTELTFQRYQNAVERAREWSVASLTEVTDLVESLGVMESGSHGTRDVQSSSGVSGDKRAHITKTLGETERVIASLERLNLELIKHFQTRESGHGLEFLVDDLEKLATRAHAYRSQS